jgi:hypothetical protein
MVPKVGARQERFMFAGGGSGAVGEDEERAEEQRARMLTKISRVEVLPDRDVPKHHEGSQEHRSARRVPMNVKATCRIAEAQRS